MSEGKADWLQYTWYDVNRKVSISTMLVAVSLRIAAHVMQLVWMLLVGFMAADVSAVWPW